MNGTLAKPFSLRRWILATFWGWLLGIVLILLLSSLLESIGIHHLQFYLGVGISAGVGFTQWLFLKKLIPLHQNWIWFSMLGMGVPFLFFDLLPNNVLNHKLPFSILAGALFTALLQTQILKKHSGKAQQWIAGTAIAWPLAVATVFTIDYTKVLPFGNLMLAIVNLLLILAGGLVLGGISGLILKKIL